MYKQPYVKLAITIKLDGREKTRSERDFSCTQRLRIGVHVKSAAAGQGRATASHVRPRFWVIACEMTRKLETRLWGARKLWEISMFEKCEDNLFVWISHIFSFIQENFLFFSFLFFFISRGNVNLVVRREMIQSILNENCFQIHMVVKIYMIEEIYMVVKIRLPPFVIF